MGNRACAPDPSFGKLHSRPHGSTSSKSIYTSSLSLYHSRGGGGRGRFLTFYISAYG